MIDIIEYVEKCFKTKLLKYQKFILHNAIKDKYYLTYPPRHGRTYFKEMFKEWIELNASKN